MVHLEKYTKVSILVHLLSIHYHIGQNVKTGDDVAIKLVSQSPYLMLTFITVIGACKNQVSIVTLWDKDLQNT